MEIVVQGDSVTRLNAVRSGELDITTLEAPQFAEAEAEDLVTAEYDTTGLARFICTNPDVTGPGAPGDVATFVDALVADNAFPARPGRPEEFASLVLQVIGNDMFNGATIRLDAGARLRARPGT